MTFETAIDDLCAKLQPVMELSFVDSLESHEAAQNLTALINRRSAGAEGTSGMILTQASEVLSFARTAGFEEDDDFFLADLACEYARAANMRPTRIAN